MSVDKSLICAVASTALLIGGLSVIVQQGRADYAARLQCESSGEVMIRVNSSRFCATLQEEVKP